MVYHSGDEDRPSWYEEPDDTMSFSMGTQAPPRPPVRVPYVPDYPAAPRAPCPRCRCHTAKAIREWLWVAIAVAILAVVVKVAWLAWGLR